MNSAGYLLALVMVASTLPVSAQQIRSILTPVTASLPPTLSPELQRKVLSGELLSHLSRKLSDAKVHGVTSSNAFITAAIYASTAPSPGLVAALEALGVEASPGSWIPPLENHPLGFFIARVPTEKFVDVLAIAEVKKMDTAERFSTPQNNLAAIAVKANLAWAASWTGTGVKVGVLDSGLDDRMPASELPSPIAKKDYSGYPTSIDTIVRNMASPHGTHVVGTVLGRGGWSAGNTANGGGSYKGMAPAADLVFLKIGNDSTSNATNAAMIAAVKAAVDTFSVKEISMSYGGWDTYHDGSDALSQVFDYAYGKGVACFVASGNAAADGHHFSGTVNAHDTSGYIQINVTGAGVNTTFLEMNLLWSDGAAHNGLMLLYYNSVKAALTTTRYAPTESTRGTESEDSFYSFYVPSGNSTYYVRVYNPSAAVQPYHLFFYGLFSNVVFAAPDQNYTVGTPALADHVFAVGASTSRVNWTASNNLSYHYTTGSALSDIAYFSSRGPRIDGLQKPNITAPGTAIISLRDRDMLTTTDVFWISNDGVNATPTNYYVMQGTSMATPVCAGSAALVYQHSPLATPQQIYNALMQNAVVDGFTGSVPNSAWGYGKLDVNAAITNIPLPVELASFTASAAGSSVTLSWKTASEVNNYGFEVQKRIVVRNAGLIQPTAQTVQPWSVVGFVAGNGSSNSPHAYSIADKPKDAGTYSYRLKQIDKDGKFEYSAEIEVERGITPIAYSLDQNYPNPFNPVTQIRFSIGADQRVHVAVYDLLGRVVADLVNEQMHAGRYTVEWNGANAASGIYFCRLDAGNYSAVKKLVLQK